MASSGTHPLDGQVEIDETVVGGEEKGIRGRKNKNKKLVQVIIERKNRGISRMYAKVIKDASTASLRPLIEKQVSKTASIRTDGWTVYNPLKKE